MADLSAFKSDHYWGGELSMWPYKMAQFAEAVETAINEIENISIKDVEVVGDGKFLRVREPSASITSPSAPPEGEGDWVLPTEDHVGEDTP